MFNTLCVSIRTIFKQFSHLNKKKLYYHPKFKFSLFLTKTWLLISHLLLVFTIVHSVGRLMKFNYSILNLVPSQRSLTKSCRPLLRSSTETYTRKNKRLWGQNSKIIFKQLHIITARPLKFAPP